MENWLITSYSIFEPGEHIIKYVETELEASDFVKIANELAIRHNQPIRYKYRQNNFQNSD